MVRIERRGFALAAVASGLSAPDAPAILVSNSLAATTEMWAPQLDALEARFRVLRYDTRGHGASETPPGPYSFNDLVDDAVAVLDHFGVEQADMLGLSLGGMTALGLGLDRPNRIKRLIVAAARADAPAPFVKSWDDRVAMIRQDGMEAVLEGTLERWLTDRFRESEPEAVASVRRMILATRPIGYMGCAAALKTLDYARRLGDLTKPTLYIAGAEDVGAPAEVMRAMADATPLGRYVEIADAAHIVNMDQPEAFTAALTDFLDG